MSENRKQNQEHNSNSFSEHNQVSQNHNQDESAVHRRSNKRPRAGGLLLQAYQKPKGGISPNRVLIAWITKLVDSIKLGGTGSSTTTEALDLFEAATLAIRSGPILWDLALTDQVVGILKSHPTFSQQNIDTDPVVFALHQTHLPPKRMEPTRNVGEGLTALTGVGSVMSGNENGIVNLLRDVGPACTRTAQTFRETLTELSPNPLSEASLARVLFFFSDKRSDASNGVSLMGVSSTLLGSLIPGRSSDGSGDGWNLSAVVEVLKSDYANVDWNVAASQWDFQGFLMKDSDQFQALLELFRAGSSRIPPLTVFTRQWRNSAGQLSVLESIASVSSSIYKCQLNDDEILDASTAAPGISQMNVDCFASMEVLQRLLVLSDIPALYRRVRDLFVKGLLTSPEVLLCSLVRLQLHIASNPAQPGRENFANAGMQIKTESMRELIPLFFRANAHHRVQNAPAALRRLYAISPNTVTAACFEAWRSTVVDTPQMQLATLMHIINIARLMPSPADAIAALLNGGKDPEFSIAIAFVMADNEYLQLKAWVVEKLSSKASAVVFATAIVSYLSKTHTIASPRNGRGADLEGAPLVSIENIVISIQVLQTLDASIENAPYAPSSVPGTTLGTSIRSLIEAALAAHPSIRGSLSATANTSSAPPRAADQPPAASDDVEEMATSYFQQIYTSEQSIGEVVEMLKRFKSSGNSKENEIFACMVHNLFDEYRFFSRYPEKELRITGILFGTLIQEQLVSSITLGIALRYVLEALRKPPSAPGQPPSHGKMFQFGMFALEQFKGRLHEWPQYCSHIVNIPHLREGYADLVSEIEVAMQESQERAANDGGPTTATGPDGSSAEVAGSMPPSATGGSVATSSNSSDGGAEWAAAGLTASKRIAEFGPLLGRAVTDGVDEEKDTDSPADSLLDRVQFLINNLVPSNVEAKAQDLKDMLDPKYFGWLANFLVVKRISTQANFHTLYLSLLDNLGEYGRGLVEAILESVYQNIGKLLRSPTITTSSSERSYLKNLGIWLGQITLARNRPILQIMLDCKELLLQGYETGKLIAVAPFLAKTLEGANKSVIFRPRNPWLMGLLGVFRSVYNVDGLKMNIKFEVEVLCKNLGLKLEDIPLKNRELGKRIAPTKEKNPDFNIKSSVPKTPTPAPVSGDDQDTVIPNLAAYVTINSSLTQLLQQQPSAMSALDTAALKRAVPIAVDRAIREIISPVVERSVTIACITTKEIVTKDFAMESDENKMRKAGQLMVANMAGSLALVTCREPLRSSVSTHLRQLLTSTAGGAEKLNEKEQNIIEHCVQICSTDNLELGCRLIEKAATEKAIRDVEEALSQPLSTRQTHREQTGQPFYDMSIFGNSNQRYPSGLPDQLRPQPGGLRPEHLQLYDSFQRLPRQIAGPAATNSAIMPGRSAPLNSNEAEPSPGSTKSQAGIETLAAIAAKLDSAVAALLSAAGPRAPEIKLSMLPADHQIRQLIAAVKQVLPNLSPSGAVTRQLTQSEQEAVLGFSQGIFKRLYELNLSEPLRLEALVALLESVNASCPKLGKDIGTWATYAPTNTETQRRLHRTVLLLLVRSHLLMVGELDVFLAARADQGRNPIWVEFSLFFVRTAFMERIAAPKEIPKLMEMLTKIGEGRSQASPQVLQAYRKPILRMLEETRALTQTAVGPNPIAGPEQRHQTLPLKEASSLSTTSLSRMMTALKKVAEATETFARSDPANTKQQVATFLENWIRIHNEAGENEKIQAQFLQYLQQVGVGKDEEHTERFLRNSILIVMEAVAKSAQTSGGQPPSLLNYSVIDILGKLFVLMFRHLPNSSSEKAEVQRLSMLNKIMGVSIRCMMFDAEKSKVSGTPWDQRPWFRLLLNLLIDINKPDPVVDPIKLGVLSVFGAAFHGCQPLVLPGFAFSWFELVSHRHFLPNVLLVEGQRGWEIAHQLLVDFFLFLEPHLKGGVMTPPIKKLYEGALRVFLVLLHDFPTFLTGYHLSLCNVIPDTCVQLRNLVLSANPKGVMPPDPFTPNLKIDLLPEISQSPILLSNILGPIEAFRGPLDAFLKDGKNRSFLAGLPQQLDKVGLAEIDPPKVNSLVVYIGIHALARLQNSQISLSRTPEIEVLQRLMELDDKRRYTCLNAIANQLRFPSSHTHYFSCVTLYLFSESKDVGVKEQITRVLLERLILFRPHPWGLLITFIELIKNQRYGFWNYPFTRCATEIEKVFESVARSCMPPGSQQSTVVGGGDE